MAKANVNRQNLLVVRLFRVRRHFVTCKICRGARSAGSFDALCSDIKRELIEIAIAWDGNISGRLAAVNGNKEWIFPCPDPNAHGAAYAATAEPVIIAGKQETLF